MNRGKRIFITGILLAFVMCITMTSAYAAEANQVSLNLDGKKIETEVAPVIVESRTLIPVRALFEGSGGKVTWVAEKPSDITIEYEGKVIKLVTNSKIALVDGTEKTMDVAAQLFPGDRVMIPVRFVAEELDFGVDWDNETRTVLITSPNTVPTITTPNAVRSNVKSLSVSANGKYHRVTVKADGPMVGHTENQLDNPSRFFVDLKGFDMKANPATMEYHETTSVIKGVRASQLDAQTTRVVVDLKTMSVPKISFSANKQEMYLDFELLPFNPMADGKLVVMLDPGHGKETGGKRSFDESLFEYEFNRDVARRLTTLLQQAGIEVLTTAPTDVDTSLADRCALANNSNADIFVSIHANAFGTTWNNANGWEVYTYKKGGIAEELAKSVHTASMPKLGITDRGVKESNLYVLRNTNMPAILIEHGFYTNKTELALLKSDAFRQKCAEADAAGIINFLKAYQK